MRSVEIGPRLTRSLREHVASERERRRLSEDAFVFLRPSGEPHTRYSLRDLHRQAAADLGLRESVRLHDLRHTAAASWLAAGLPLIYVQRQLGHADYQTTVKQYGAPRGELHARGARARRAGDLGGRPRGRRRRVARRR